MDGGHKYCGNACYKESQRLRKKRVPYISEVKKADESLEKLKKETLPDGVKRYPVWLKDGSWNRAGLLLASKYDNGKGAIKALLRETSIRY